MIRTVRELVAPADVRAALPHEHVLHNIGRQVPTLTSADLEIRTEDLVNYRRAPFANGSRNLLMQKEDEVFRELERLQLMGTEGDKKALKTLVVDVALPIEGRDVFAKERLRLDERLPGVQLLTVTTFPVERIGEFPLGLTPKQQSERIAKVLEAELMFGIGSEGEVVYPGAIYQQVHCADVCFNDKEQILAQGLALAQAQTHAPLYLSFTFDEQSTGNTVKLEQALQAWLRVLLDAGAESRKLVVCHMDRWCRGDLEGPGYCFLKEILSLGVSVLFDMIGLLTVSDVPLFNPCCRTPSSGDEEWQEPPSDSRLVRWIAALAKDHLHQLLLSTNVHQRIQYRRYGGGGYTYLFEHFRTRLQRQGVTDCQWDQLVRGNVVDLLAWYVPPEAPPIPKNYLQCSICGNYFEPIEGEYFTKFTFIYCGTKCLRRHSRNKFAPLPPK